MRGPALSYLKFRVTIIKYVSEDQRGPADLVRANRGSVVERRGRGLSQQLEP